MSKIFTPVSQTLAQLAKYTSFGSNKDDVVEDKNEQYFPGYSDSDTESDKKANKKANKSSDKEPPVTKEKQTKDKEEPSREPYQDRGRDRNYGQVKQYKQKTPQGRFDELVQLFYSFEPHTYNAKLNHELEVKFGTKGIRPLTHIDYENVIKRLKSTGYYVIKTQHYLRVNCEFLDSATGRFKLSDVRTEIKGTHNIQEYCVHNDIKSLYNTNPTVIEFIHKKAGYIDKQRIQSVDMDDFNFRLSYQTEEQPKQGVKTFIIDNWRQSKKEFRFLKRVSFEHHDLPFIIDMSITKFGNRVPDKYGRENRGPMHRVFTLAESNVFNNPEIYEIEIEIDNNSIGPYTAFDTPQKLIDALRSAIKNILCALQKTNYPVSYIEQREVLESYMQLLWKDEFDPKKPITSKYFIGPNSITLQMANIALPDENSLQPNIRKDFLVTEKADGERQLMYIASTGKIYFINTNMDIIFTGAKTNNEDLFETLIDGELIKHNKNKEFINQYAAFDVYYIKKQDVRAYPFVVKSDEEDIYKCRSQLLSVIYHNLDMVSIMNLKKTDKKTAKDISKEYLRLDDLMSPVSFTIKEFFPAVKSETIFEGCNTIMEKVSEGRFAYETDGLIFTHKYFGVGSNVVGKSGPKTKITWEHSFKWKPPEFNTIDFLVTTIKTANNKDVVSSRSPDGISLGSVAQIDQYKTIELRCGFSESRDAFINPCQDIIDDKLPEYKGTHKSNDDYLPKRFYPTDPYDANAGICNIPLLNWCGNNCMLTEAGEEFGDNTIVEFRYDLEREEGWRWVPLRVRHDKTSKLLRGEKEYGNSYNTCNENWKTIHPTGRITEDMIRTGQDIPDIVISGDKYYNTPTGKFKTESMKHFHNLYVKKLLISSVSKPSDIFIDFACGKAGDLSKWIYSKLSFVFGVDLSKDNLENRLDGACARFLRERMKNKSMPYALFVNGNSSLNIKDGTAMLSDKGKQITNAVFGKGSKDSEKIGKGVARQYGIAVDGFNVSSCQFALHYFFQSPETLKEFVKNVAECTRVNGYFIGTCYDGKLVFNKLRDIEKGDSVRIIEDGKKLWEIVKQYDNEVFEDDSSSIGYKIDVFQESINQVILEYLVNFDYFNRVMSNFGFELISPAEAKDNGLPNATGTFYELFLNMEEEVKMNRFKEKYYGNSLQMSDNEKEISFLNRYFVYKKVRAVNTDIIELEISEYEESALKQLSVQLKKDKTPKPANKSEKLAISKKPRVRKLNKKLLLQPATEAVDEKATITDIEKDMREAAIVKLDELSANPLKEPTVEEEPAGPFAKMEEKETKKEAKKEAKEKKPIKKTLKLLPKVDKEEKINKKEKELKEKPAKPTATKTKKLKILEDELP